MTTVKQETSPKSSPRNVVSDLVRGQKVSVIVPFYNEGGNVVRNVERLDAEIAAAFTDYEIICVSDGSTDGTAEELESCSNDRVSAYAYRKNVGKGYALRYGFERSTGDVVIFIDGGMELNPAEIGIMLGLMHLYEADAVIGSKRHPQSLVHYPLIRRCLSRVYQGFVRLTLGLNVRDTQVGLKVFRREMLEDVMPRLLVKRFAFDLELLAVAYNRGFTKILEAPIRLDFSMNGRTRNWPELWRIRKMMWHLFVDTLAVVYRVRILKWYQRDISESVPGDRAAAAKSYVNTGREVS